ncbi:MAG: hypothetical protein ACI9G1_004122 [Pirellulaceae bacterium]|jgi:hypothetical protein
MPFFSIQNGLGGGYSSVKYFRRESNSTLTLDKIAQRPPDHKQAVPRHPSCRIANRLLNERAVEFTESSVLKPLFPFNGIGLIEFLVRLRQVNNALDRRDDSEDNGNDYRKYETHSREQTAKSQDQHDHSRRVQPQDELVNSQLTKKYRANARRDLLTSKCLYIRMLMFTATAVSSRKRDLEFAATIWTIRRRATEIGFDR